MPRKSLEEIEAKPTKAPADIGPAVESKPDAVVVSTSNTTTRKVKLDLEVDTSV